ncbi:hypothetical protein FH063_004252 [Azospirillum argentinense]|uniref:Uncharacterized protein n=1 Tax=Azospirillum argentinense TaxID=2970906 RepID=A0A5B0KKL7_9PROT|nr:hypothetical protein FH063_004252 [Azospirillum argentinense]
MSGPGGADRPAVVTGRWRRDPADPTRIVVDFDGHAMHYRIRVVSANEMQLEEDRGPSGPGEP